MEIGVLSISHEKAPVEVREQVAFTDKKKIEAMDGLLDLPQIEEALVLSTCNRSEVYLVAHTIKEALIQAKDFLGNFFQLDLEPYLIESIGKEAIQHLYKVSCGLDSLVLGEDQILGQVKEALEFAMEIGSSKKFLNKIFREAITFSKKMRATYKISEHPLSLGYIGVKFIKDKVGELSNCNIFIVGTGEMGTLVFKYLIAEGANQIFVSNRSETRCKVEEFSSIHPNIKWVSYEERYEIVQKMDVLFCATSSPHTIFKKERYQQSEKKQWMLDLAIPRDIDEKIGELEGIELYNIDDLKVISKENKALREDTAKKIEVHIEDEVAQTLEWIHFTKVDPIIQSLQELSEEVARDTIDMIHKKMVLSKRETEYLNKLIRASLKRMVRTPIQALKSLKEEEEIKAYKEMLHKLYDL